MSSNKRSDTDVKQQKTNMVSYTTPRLLPWESIQVMAQAGDTEREICKLSELKQWS